jgi:hypothetical protein
MVNPIHSHLSVTVCKDAADAIARGYDYTKHQPQPTPIAVKEVVVVRSGTEAGNATVDFVLEDEAGQRFVFMVTGNLLKSIPC